MTIATIQGGKYFLLLEIHFTFMTHTAKSITKLAGMTCHPMLAEGVIVPVPYHMAWPISPFSDISLTTWASRAVIVLIPHGPAEVIYTP
jgi:hypothetical protein